MTGTDILTTAALHTEGDTISTTNGLVWINECMIMDLASDAQVQASGSVVATEDTWMALPAGVLEVYEIWRAGDDVPYYGRFYGEFYKGLFDIQNLQIRLPETNTFTVKYYRVPTAIAALSETPEVHAQFHYPISLWVAHKHKKYYDEGSKAAERLLAEYMFNKGLAIERLKAIRPTTKAPTKIRLSMRRY